MKISASVPPHKTGQTHELNETCGTESMTLTFTENITEKFKTLKQNEHFRAMITARLRNRSVAHGGLSPTPTMTAATQRTDTQRTKMIKRNQNEYNTMTYKREHQNKIDIEVEYRSFCLVYHQVYNEIEPLQLNEVLKFMISQDMVSSYPNLYTLYKIFYTLPVSSATAERSFSRLKLLKTYLRSTMTEDRLSNLAILSIESNIAQTINFNKVISTFASMKKRRKLL
ncbi:hypothetical protein AGLY_009464 [Aphis glycines]|uniref:HAT C-terminal dimerisation domain-containing protein n=1 Tax=Aphis glycines TaxID=307491 RepID=A0A6G0THI6_APHGL|nr:hypothetical protein AGLY_009464 [Aphis glycines]